MPDHHAILCVADSYTALSLDTVELATKSELVVIMKDTLSIADVRDVITCAYQRPFEKPTQTFIIDTDQIALEAQQALLKIIEEPPATTRFILVVRSHTQLLPAVRSRLHSWQLNTDKSIHEPSLIFMKFTSISSAERIALVLKLTKAKDIKAFNRLADDLTLWLRIAQPTLPIETLTSLHWSLTMLHLCGASKKMLWEDIALRLPVVLNTTDKL